MAKINEQEQCTGFWDLECDIGYNFIRYFQRNNCNNLRDYIGCKFRFLRYNSIPNSLCHSSTID
jgi:hypothetical protein